MEFIEFVGFVEFVGFIEFVGFVEFIEFVEFVEFVGFMGFVGFKRSSESKVQPTHLISQESVSRESSVEELVGW